MEKQGLNRLQSDLILDVYKRVSELAQALLSCKPG